MSVVSCTFARDKTRRMDVRVPFDHRYTEIWDIVTNDATDGHLTIFDGAMTATPNPLPYKLATYAPPFTTGDADVNVRAYDFSLQQRDHRQKEWTATVLFRPPEAGEDTEPEDIPDNPLDRPIKIWFEYVQFNDEEPEDKNGLPVVNKAGQPYPEKVVLTDYRPVFVIRRNYASYEAIFNLNETYRRTVNSDPFVGQDPGTLRYQQTSMTESRVENGVTFYEGTTRVEYRSEGWHVVKVEEGWKFYNNPGAADFELMTPMDADGNPLGEPVLLAANGGRAPAVQGPILTSWSMYDSVAYLPLVS